MMPNTRRTLNLKQLLCISSFGGKSALVQQPLQCGPLCNRCEEPWCLHVKHNRVVGNFHFYFAKVLSQFAKITTTMPVPTATMSNAAARR